MSKTVEIKMTLPAPPEGYEYTGEFLDGFLLVDGKAPHPSGTAVLRKKRWRAENDHPFFAIIQRPSDNRMRTMELYEDGSQFCDTLYSDGNYFKEETVASSVIAKFRELLKEVNP